MINRTCVQNWGRWQGCHQILNDSTNFHQVKRNGEAGYAGEATNNPKQNVALSGQDWYNTSTQARQHVLLGDNCW